LTGTLTSRYQEDVLRPCREVVNGRYPFTPTSATDLPLADFGRVFGYNGVFDAFYRDELEDLVDRTRRPWRWRTDASGASVGGGFDLSQFELAQRIRDIFFRQGSQEPGVRFTVTPIFLDPGAGRFNLEVDGQMLDYRYGPERSVAMTWPGPSPNMAVASFQQSAGQPNFVAEGPWAWFRLMGDAQIARETDTRYVLTFLRGAREARIRVDAATVQNPMASDDWQRFRCG
jgi:type VI secretion system protein ImpL